MNLLLELEISFARARRPGHAHDHFFYILTQDGARDFATGRLRLRAPRKTERQAWEMSSTTAERAGWQRSRSPRVRRRSNPLNTT